MEREQFDELTENLNDIDLLREILYTQQKSFNLLEKTRNNTSKLVWFLVAIPIISVVIYFIFKNLSYSNF
ncbi:MAG: hypothetical protein APF83_04715 [Lutibacter sp. BRH_c52]|nr:MAG: hypothetical protein APF83_04715 [Lutibacter sp. BRH_c52]